MDVNRMLRAPTFNPNRNENPLGMGANAQLSSTGMLGHAMHNETS